MSTPTRPANPLDLLSDRLLGAITPERLQEISARMRARAPSFFDMESGPLISCLSAPLLFPERAYVEAQRAAEHLFEAQRAILGRLEATIGREGILRMFSLPPSLLRFVDWEALGAAPAARLDILMTSEGRPLFCEMNVDSSIGGAEGFELTRLFLEESGLAHALSAELRGLCSPCELVADLLLDRLVQGNKKQIVLLDWSTWAKKGYWSLDTLRRYVEARAGGVPVRLCDEAEYARALDAGAAGSGDVVYRLFMFDDIVDHLPFYERLLGSGASICMGFESEILSSKLWSALLHDGEWRRYLSRDQIAAIDEFTPRASQLTNDNVERALAEKDRYVFKAISSFGGAGVLIGQEHPRAAIDACLRRTGPGSWIAQELVHGSSFTLRSPGQESADYNAVYGLYRIGGAYSGVLVRGSRSRRVVNIASGGAVVGWGVPASEQLSRQLASALAAS